MLITQQDLDRFGVAQNELHNTNVEAARGIMAWAEKCGVPLGTLAVNFQNAVGGPWQMPIVPVAEIKGASVNPSRQYCFVAMREDGSTNLAYVAMLMQFYGAWDVLQRLSAEVNRKFDPMASEHISAVVRAAVEEAAPKV